MATASFCPSCQVWPVWQAKHAARLHWQNLQQAGAPNTCDVISILERNIKGDGNQTNKYPLQVLFELLGLRPSFAESCCTGTGPQ